MCGKNVNNYPKYYGQWCTTHATVCSQNVDRSEVVMYSNVLFIYTRPAYAIDMTKTYTL